MDQAVPCYSSLRCNDRYGHGKAGSLLTCAHCQDFLPPQEVIVLGQSDTTLYQLLASLFLPPHGPIFLASSWVDFRALLYTHVTAFLHGANTN